MLTGIFFVLAILGILAGMAGTVIPILPGVPLAFVSIFLYGIYDKFEHITVPYLITIGIFMVISLVVDQLSMILGMKYFQSDNRAIIGSTLGGVIGLFVWPPFGVLIFCFLGAFLVEYWLHHDSERAFHSSIGALLGFISGTLFKIGTCIIFFISFIFMLV